MVEIRSADSSRLAHVAEVIGRAFVTEPMMTWGLRGLPETLEERCIRFHELFLEPLMDREIVWESGDGHGALVLVPPEEADALDDALAIDETEMHKVTDDGGQRYELFWEWVGSNVPREPFWHLDSVAVRPGWQGRGIGSALIEFGLELARGSGAAMALETGTQRNVSLYERLGFHVVKEADAPEGGPHVWFMRRDPQPGDALAPLERFKSGRPSPPLRVTSIGAEAHGCCIRPAIRKPPPEPGRIADRRASSTYGASALVSARPGRPRPPNQLLCTPCSAAASGPESFAAAFLASLAAVRGAGAAARRA